MKKNIAVLLFSVMVAGILSGCANDAQLAKKVAAVQDLGNARIAVQEGSAGDIYITDAFDTAEISRFSQLEEAVNALHNDEADAVVMENKAAEKLAKEDEAFTVLPDILYAEEYAFAVKDGRKTLLQSINDAIGAAERDGILKKIHEAYFESNETALSELKNQGETSGESTLIFGVCAKNLPFEYRSETGAFSGMNVDLATYIARYLGMNLQIIDMEYDDLLPALQNGKVDMIVSPVPSETDKRYPMIFSHVFHSEYQMAVVRK